MSETLTNIPQGYGAWKLNQIADLEGLRPSEMAERLKMSRAAYSYMRKQVSGFMRSRTVLNICSVFNMSLDEFAEDLVDWQNIYSPTLNKSMSVIMDDTPIELAKVINDSEVKGFIAKIAKNKYGFSDEQCKKIINSVVVEKTLPSTAREILKLN